MWVFTLVGVAAASIAALLTLAYFTEIDELDGSEEQIKFGP